MYCNGGPWAASISSSIFYPRAKAHSIQIPLHLRPPTPRKKVEESMNAAAGNEEEDQARMAAIADGLQKRDAMRLYNWVSQRCFSDCVVTFYRKALGKGEADCVRACVRKYLLLTTASAARFADFAGPTADD